MKKCIASGAILSEKDEEGKLKKEIVATVYAEEVNGSESGSSVVAAESGSSVAEGRKSVLLKYKDFAYGEDVVNPITFEDIAAVATLTVPGLDGHADVTLEAPMVVRYAKTKSFEYNGNTVVSASIRYDM